MAKYVQRALREIVESHFDSWDDLLSECGLDFTAELRPFYYKSPAAPEFDEPEDEEVQIEVEKHDDYYLCGQPYASAIVRTDKEWCLGVGSTVYGVVQYRQWLSVAEELYEKGIKVVYAGAPNLGERAYMILEVPDSMMSLGEGDEIVNRLLITASHDCSTKLTLAMLPFRPSNNTYMTFERSILAEKHSRHVNNRVTKAKEVMSKVKRGWKEFDQHVKKMSLVKPTDEEARDFIENVIGKGDASRTVNVRDKIFDLWKHEGVGRAVPACRGTLFGLVQATCEWADHYATVRKSKFMDEATAEFNSKLLGAAAQKKAKAWSFALTMKHKKLSMGG